MSPTIIHIRNSYIHISLLVNSVYNTFIHLVYISHSWLHSYSSTHSYIFNYQIHLYHIYTPSIYSYYIMHIIQFNHQYTHSVNSYIFHYLHNNTLLTFIFSQVKETLVATIEVKQVTTK